MKCVMIVDENLPRGLIANTAAVLGISLSQGKKDLVGQAVLDKSGRQHEGITSIPIPILALGDGEIKDLHDRIRKDADAELQVIGFNDIAQRCLDYEDYEEKLRKAGQEEIGYLGLCLYGPKKKVNRWTGSLKMLR